MPCVLCVMMLDELDDLQQRTQMKPINHFYDNNKDGDDNGNGKKGHIFESAPPIPHPITIQNMNFKRSIVLGQPLF